MRHAGSAALALTLALLGGTAMTAAAAIATAGAARAAQDDSLTIFGDSFSTPTRSGFPQWPTQLRSAGDIGAFTSFARGGARAASRIGSKAIGNSFASQVKRWQAAGRPLGDATFVYFGYNDLLDAQNAPPFSQSKAGYSSGVKALLDAGADSGGRELFLVMPHDLGGMPRFNGDPAARQQYRSRTKTWNSFVAGQARSTGATAVNLAAVIDNVLADPGRFGLSNVTTPAPGNRAALYHDDIHFGETGQGIIKNAFAEQLSNAGLRARRLELARRAGAERRAASADAMRAGLAALAEAEAGGEPLGLVAVPVGGAAARAGAGLAGLADPAAAAVPSAAAADPATAQFALAYAPAEAREGGLALAWALPGAAATIGLIVTDYGAADEASILDQTAGARLASRTVELQVGHRLGAFELETRLSHGRDRHAELRFDDITGEHRRATFGGATVALAQRVGRPVEGEAGGRGYVVTPWAELAHETRRDDGFTLSSPFTPDQAYAASEVSDTLASVGLDARLDPIELGEGRWLSLWGGVSYAHGLAQDDYRVRITEAAFGTTSERTVERPDTRALALGLGASLTLSERLSLDGSLALEHDLAQGTAEAGRVGLTYRF